jgi:hypothetical protein
MFFDWYEPNAIWWPFFIDRQIFTLQVCSETDEGLCDVQNLSLLESTVLLLSVFDDISQFDAIISCEQVDFNAFHAHVVLFVYFDELDWSKVFVTD